MSLQQSDVCMCAFMSAELTHELKVTSSKSNSCACALSHSIPHTHTHTNIHTLTLTHTHTHTRTHTHTHSPVTRLKTPCHTLEVNKLLCKEFSVLAEGTS